MTLLPIVGHNSLSRDIFGDASPALTSTNLASDGTIAAVKLLIDATLRSFPTAPILHIGWDEVDTSGVAKTTTAPAFCAAHQLPTCSSDEIVEHFLTEINEYVRAKNPVNLGSPVRLMPYENINTKGTENHTVITQPWWINGGNGYMEDQIKSNLHGNTLAYAKLNLTTMQTAWKPRVYTRLHGVYDHAVAGTIYPHPHTGPGSAPKCKTTTGVKYNNTNWANVDGPIDSKDPAECCAVCSSTASVDPDNAR